MRMMFALLLAFFALTAMAIAPVDAANTLLPMQTARSQPVEQDRLSGYRDRFGGSASSRNAHHLASELADPAADEAIGCPDANASPAFGCEKEVPCSSPSCEGRDLASPPLPSGCLVIGGEPA